MLLIQYRLVADRARADPGLHHRPVTVAAIALLIVNFLLVDSVFRRNTSRSAARISMTLAVITSILLAIKFWWQILIVAVFAIGLYLAVDNLRVLWATFRRPEGWG